MRRKSTGASSGRSTATSCGGAPISSPRSSSTSRASATGHWRRGGPCSTGRRCPHDGARDGPHHGRLEVVLSSPDTGAADPRLAAALAAGDPAEVAAALVDARLIVGVVALPGEQVASEGEMALALLESARGTRALPAFTSLA